MPLEEFIITVFCWVETAFEDVTAGIKLRTRGFAPRLSDSEVITLEIVGEVLGYDGDEAIWSYFKRHWAAWFPGLGDRSTFVRQAANLWRIKQVLHERLVAELGARTTDGHIIDGFPIAVCKVARAVRSQVLKAEADYGYGAAKRAYYYGLKAYLLIDWRGAARAQAHRNGHQPTRATLQLGENSSPRRLAFDQSSDPQAVGPYHGSLAQPPPRSRAARFGRLAGRLIIKVAHRVSRDFTYSKKFMVQRPSSVARWCAGPINPTR